MKYRRRTGQFQGNRNRCEGVSQVACEQNYKAVVNAFQEIFKYMLKFAQFPNQICNILSNYFYYIYLEFISSSLNSSSI